MLDQDGIQATADEATETRLQTVLVWGVVAYVALATFPEFRVSSLTPGVDASWIWALNHLAGNPNSFGSDMAFTYGPLGFMLLPLQYGWHQVASWLVWLIAQSTLVLTAILHYQSRRSLAAIVLFAGAYLLAGSFGLAREYRLLLLVALILSLVPVRPRLLPIIGTTASLVAAFLLFVKFSTGLAGLAMILVAGFGSWAQRRTSFRALLGSLLVPYAAAVLLLGILLLGGPRGLVRWLSVSIDISREFSTAMSVPQPLPLVTLGTAAALSLGVATILVRQYRDLVLCALPLIPFVYVALRHSFVRAFGLYVFGTVLAALSVLFLRVSSRRPVFFLAPCFLAALLLGAAAVSQPHCLCAWRPSDLLPLNGAQHLSAVLDVWPDGSSDTPVVQLSEDSLPEPWLKEIGHSTVDILPSELAVVPANRFRWRPNPVLQAYHVYSSDLDALVAQHFASARKPDYLLVQWLHFDSRHVLQRSPLMWREIATRYEPAGPFPAPIANGDVVLLEERQSPVSLERRTLGGTRSKLGEWIDVPASDGLVFGNVRMNRNLRGRLNALLWRTDMLIMDVSDVNGSVRSFGVLPSTAADGLFVSHLPNTLEEFVAFLRGELPDPITRIRFRGPGATSFDQTLAVTWWSTLWSPEDD